MIRYKVLLQYFHLNTVISSHEFTNSANQRILNEEDVFIGFRRSEKYHAIFQETTTQYVFAKKEFEYIKTVWEDYKTKLNSDYFMQMNLYIVDEDSNINSFSEVFEGVADWSNTNYTSNKYNVSFIQKGDIQTLSNSDEVEYNIDASNSLITKKYSFNTFTLLQTDIQAKYFLGTGTGFDQNEINIDLAEGSFSNFNVQLANTQEELKLPLFESYKDNVTVQPFLNLNQDRYRLIFTINDFSVKFAFEFIANSLELIIDMSIFVRYSTKTDEFKLVEGVEVDNSSSQNPNEIFFANNNPIVSSFDLDTNLFNEKVEVNLQLRWRRKQQDNTNPLLQTSIIVFEDDFCNIQSQMGTQNYDLNVVDSKTVFDKLCENLNIEIDNDIIGGQNSRFIIPNNLYFSTGKSLLGNEFLFKTKFYEFFKDISSLFGLALQYENNRFKIVYIQDVYNIQSEAISIGEAKDLEISSNNFTKYKDLLFGSSDQENEFIYGDKEYNIATSYTTKNQDSLTFESQLTNFRSDSMFFNKLFMDLVTDKLKEEDKITDNKAFLLVLDVLEEVTSFFSPTPETWEDKYGKPLNLEICSGEQFKNWSGFILSMLTDFNSIGLSSALKNTSVKYDSFLENDLSSVPLIVSKSDIIFDNKNAFFKHEYYDAKIDLTPSLIEKIRGNKTKMYHFTFENNDYYGFIESVELNPFTAKSDSIKLIQANKL